MADAAQLFGIPGFCYDIDGDWWHEPGSVTVDPGFEKWLREGGDLPPSRPVKCCGVVGVDDVPEVSRG